LIGIAKISSIVIVGNYLNCHCWIAVSPIGGLSYCYGGPVSAFRFAQYQGLSTGISASENYYQFSPSPDFFDMQPIFERIACAHRVNAFNSA
jgi:hypothetical protein